MWLFWLRPHVWARIAQMAVCFFGGCRMVESRLGFSPITELGRLDELFASSSESPVVIFKHSSTCPISAGAFQEMNGVSVPVHLVVVQTSREVSDSIESRTGVRHESPQVI